MDYTNLSKQLKAISDPNRLKIIDLLSCGTMCACDILEHFEFTQPTLSHHMRILQDAKVVDAEKVGKWQHYTLSQSFEESFPLNIANLLANDENCICHCKNANKKEDLIYEKS
ncbi:ArsR/SmtB family transcription factor [Companilactobacillus mishanensis]|uniref:Winged helix-turn-helix transcriptional regulator n=1 Tax=Companilactobacillus mishanensis TaxID=2486008 RepID=A0A5P0ZJV6_9LACO|nr:metalloregulator ArsR/SmtB family transcription factor [Companilactobacillus mishanensis]MQS44542.1 winged helix-turn-helix transcriptional regulator [Companilactobacillus mishanensis]MQS53338.1 winged helix-turn-helix transcriptional regulator [Companilactobacillus mishanensis]MQS88780.1 winged helix-turn-helix transcriptional regulator [Companilactobacillus mishanensis]